MSRETEEDGSPEGLEALFEDVLLQGDIEDELLVRYAEDPEQLTAAERERVEAAERADPQIADQLRILRSFDASAGGETQGAEGDGGGPEADRNARSEASGGGNVVSIADHPRWRTPATLAAIAAAILAALLYGATAGIGGREKSGPRVAVEETGPIAPERPSPDSPLAPIEDTLEPPAPFDESPGRELAEERPAEPGLEAIDVIPNGEPTRETRLAEAPSPAPSEPVPPPDSAPSPAPRPEMRIEEPEETREPILLAMHVTGPLRYEAPPGVIELPPLGVQRRVVPKSGAESPDGSLGAGAGEIPVLTVLAPRHVARTAQPSPTLYWHLSQEVALPGRIVVTDQRADDPVIEIGLDAPVRAGIHAIDLAALAIELKVGSRYRWFVSIGGDSVQDATLAAYGGIERLEPESKVRAELDAAEPGDRGRLLAARGYWYDALDFISGLVEEQPGEERLQALRSELLAGARLSLTTQTD